MTTTQEWMSELLYSGSDIRHRFGGLDRTAFLARMAELFDQAPLQGIASDNVGNSNQTALPYIQPAIIPSHYIYITTWEVILAEDEVFQIRGNIIKASDAAGAGWEVMVSLHSSLVTVATGGPGGSTEKGEDIRYVEIASHWDTAKPFITIYSKADCSAAGTGMWGAILIPATDLNVESAGAG